MRRTIVAVLVTAFGLFTVSAVGSAGAAGTARTGIERWREAWARLQARAVWRAEHPGRALALPKTQQPASTKAWTTVKRLHQISQDNTTPRDNSEPDTQIEPYIAVEPNHPNHIVAVFQQGRFPDGGSVGPGYATSQDGGRTWVTDEFPNVTIDRGGKWDRASDPWVAFGPKGRVYAALLVFDDTCPSGVDVLRSDDGGITWNDPVDAQLDTSCSVFNDKESIYVDTFPASPHYGRIYIAWDRLASGQPIQLRYSDDKGNSWSALKGVSGGVSGIRANVIVHPDGAVSVIYIDLNNGFEVAQTSTNGGDTWGPIVNIGQDREGSPPDQRVNCGLPTAAVDPTTGNLYVAWCDVRFRSDGLNDILVWKSIDGGSTWTGPVKANPDVSGSGISHLDAGIVALNHNVFVFYQTRTKTGSTYSNKVGTSFVHSEDDGGAYINEVVVGRPSDLTWAAQAGGKFLGDYLGMGVSAKGAHPVWCRSFKPPTPQTYHQTTWSATIVP